MTIHDGVIYLYGMEGACVPGRDQYWCAAVDLQTEKLLWRTDLGARLASTSAVLAHGRVDVQRSDQPTSKQQTLMHLHALKAQTGEPIWEEEGKRGLIRECAVAGTQVFVRRAGLEVIDARSGTRKGMGLCGHRLSMAPDHYECMGLSEF